MARGARPERYDVLPNFIGGLNTVSAEVAMGETQVRAATNARITQFGAVQKRGGTKVMSNPAQFVDAAMTGLTQWELSNGTRYVVAGNNGALYTALYADMKIWALYNGLIAYLLMGALFAGEYLVRLRVKAREQQS